MAEFRAVSIDAFVSQLLPDCAHPCAVAQRANNKPARGFSQKIAVSACHDSILAIPLILKKLFWVIVPLELRLFQPEIDGKIREYQIEQDKLYAAAVESGPLQASIGQVEKRIGQREP